jgi:hypothetical membrane protein
MRRCQIVRVKLLLYPALGLSFFGSLLLAAHFFPRPYQWRWDVMSKLAEPKFNPHAYLIACAGLAVSGVLLAAFPAMLRERLGVVAPRAARWGEVFLYVAAIFLTLSGIVPGHVNPLGRWHERLAHVYGAAISISMLGYFIAALRLPRRHAVQRQAGIFLIVIPLTGFLTSQLSLIVGSRVLSAAAYHALKLNLWNSLALWEWTAAVGTYVYLGLLLTLPERGQDGPA